MDGAAPRRVSELEDLPAAVDTNIGRRAAPVEIPRQPTAGAGVCQRALRRIGSLLGAGLDLALEYAAAGLVVAAATAENMVGPGN